jgi:hypothetical protein
MHYIHLGFTTLSKKIQDYIKITESNAFQPTKYTFLSNSQLATILNPATVLSVVMLSIMFLIVNGLDEWKRI